MPSTMTPAIASMSLPGAEEQGHFFRAQRARFFARPRGDFAPGIADDFAFATQAEEQQLRLRVTGPPWRNAVGFPPPR